MIFEFSDDRYVYKNILCFEENAVTGLFGIESHEI